MDHSQNNPERYVSGTGYEMIQRCRNSVMRKTSIHAERKLPTFPTVKATSGNTRADRQYYKWHRLQ